jgi:menaquinone-specific isochorismate synthase
VSTTTGGFHARTVPLEYGPDALQFDGSPTVLFDRPGLTLVGWGTAELVAADQADAALRAIPCDDQVGGPASGVIALGALPFTDAMSGLLVIPRFTMGIASDAEGVTRRWATAVGPAGEALPSTEELFDAVIWQYGAAPEAADTHVSVNAVSSALDSDGYRTEVARTVSEMQAPGSPLRKVVLSRPLTVELSGRLALTPVLRRLRAAEPTCTVFAMPTPDGTFFGASPELLVARHESRVTCHPLAGTVPRGTTARTDADAQGRLAGSGKDRAEHRYVVDDIAATLAPVCAELTVPETPSLVTFRSVAHLGTRIVGHLAAPLPTVLQLLDRLHPTPAVGGTPRADAIAAIEAHEPNDRGYWAGPVGWVDARGDGEWVIGIRSALLNAGDAAPTGTVLGLRAGSGIVAGSDPASEAEETNVKLATVLDTVIPGASVELR